jgi:hypothetical protein
MVNELEANSPNILEEILASSFGWSKSIQPWDEGFSKDIATKLHLLGWNTIGDS